MQSLGQPFGEAFSAFAISARPIAVGARCPFIEPGLGITVTMAVTDPRLGPLGLNLMRLGYSAQRRLDEIAASDPHIEWRQVSVIDRDGNAVARTGAQNKDWSGHFCEPNMVAMGNGLISERTASAMRDVHRASGGKAVEDRLMLALEPGRDAGGQHGGQHSAALLVHRTTPCPLIDLRVDEHDEPIGEPRRDSRRIGVVDLYGHVAAFTGGTNSFCAGHITRPSATCASARRWISRSTARRCTRRCWRGSEAYWTASSSRAPPSATTRISAHAPSTSPVPAPCCARPAAPTGSGRASTPSPAATSPTWISPTPPPA